MKSKKYRIQVDFYEGYGGYLATPDSWKIYVWEKGLFFNGRFVGSRLVDHKPTEHEMAFVGRQLIDEYLAQRNKEQKAVVNVRHP